MKHELNTHNMKNDIILTTALAVSIIITEILMSFTNIANSATIFFTFAFVSTKIMYHLIYAISKNKNWI